MHIIYARYTHAVVNPVQEIILRPSARCTRCVHRRAARRDERDEHSGRLIYAVDATSAVGDKIFFGVSNALSLFVSFNLFHESRHPREERPRRLKLPFRARDARAHPRVPELSGLARRDLKTRALFGGAGCF